MASSEEWARNYIANYDGNTKIDTNDSRLTNIEAQRQQAINASNGNYNQLINESENTYNNLINNSNNAYNQMINNSQQYYDKINNTLEQGYKKQEQARNAQTQATIDEINRQKGITERDYQKEQRGAYSDYKNQTNPYGVQAEELASNGLTRTGYAESTITNAYNTYQNRVATARTSLQDSLANYQAQITSARNSNNTALAELWSNVYTQIAQNALDGFKYRNTLNTNRLQNEQNLTANKIQNKQSLTEARISNENTLQARYDSKYQNMLAQINNELDRKQNLFSIANNTVQNYDKMKQSQEQWQKEYNLKYAQYKASLSSSRRSSGSSRRSSSKKSSSNNSSRSVSNNSSPSNSQDILRNMKIIQGAGIQNRIKDGYSGRTFSSPKALLAYYGYAVQ